MEKNRRLSKANVKKSPITTILGAIIILLASSTVWFKNASWVEASIGITMGATLMFAKDKFPTLNNKS